jgi:hypothetical protein
MPATENLTAAPLNYIENRTYDEIAAGGLATITRTLKPADIQLFATTSGDAQVRPQSPHRLRLPVHQPGRNS